MVDKVAQNKSRERERESERERERERERVRVRVREANLALIPTKNLAHSMDIIIGIYTKKIYLLVKIRLPRPLAIADGECLYRVSNLLLHVLKMYMWENLLTSAR